MIVKMMMTTWRRQEAIEGEHLQNLKRLREFLLVALQHHVVVSKSE